MKTSLISDMLFDDLEIFGLADRIARRYAAFYSPALLTQLNAQYGVSRDDLRVLRLILAEEDMCLPWRSMTALSEFRPEQLKRILVDLIGKQLVRTQQQQSLEQSKVIELTPRGKAACDFAAELMGQLTYDRNTEASLTLSEAERLEIITQLIGLSRRAERLSDYERSPK